MPRGGHVLLQDPEDQVAFNTVVHPNLEVKRLPPEEEPGAHGAYGGAGSIDGKIPGRSWINLRTTSLRSKYSLADLTFHESIPGQIWQGEYTHGMPLIRQLLKFNAYSEGWGLYAEQLAEELGAYASDPVGQIGYLQSLAFRACRLVVDTGIHAKRWTREQAVQFFVDMNGSNPLEVASEVDRYCAWPGQACGYKVGHSEINRQRENAKKTLGSNAEHILPRSSPPSWSFAAPATDKSKIASIASIRSRHRASMSSMPRSQPSPTARAEKFA